MTTVQTFKKTQTHVQAMRWEGGHKEAIEICRWVGSGSAYIPPTKEDPRDYLQIPTMFGPRDLKPGEWVVKIEEHTFLNYKNEALFEEYTEVSHEPSNLVKHAQYELGLFPNEEVEFVESIIRAVEGFASYPGHSGSSAQIAGDILYKLIQFQNLLPLTDDPEEWVLHSAVDYGAKDDLWQNKRNSAALSKDGGKTYFLGNESPVDGAPVFYTSEDHNFVPQVDDEALENETEEGTTDAHDLP